MHSENQQAHPAKYKIKAASNYRVYKTYEVDDYLIAEALVHVLAHRIRPGLQKDEELVISVFDNKITEGSNLVAQYQKTRTSEGFKSFVSVTL